MCEYVFAFVSHVDNEHFLCKTLDLQANVAI